MDLRTFPILLICFASGTNVKPNKKLLVFAVTTERTDGYLLFLRSLRAYGLKLQKLYPTGQNYTGHALKINILNKELEIYKERSDVIVLFTDTYDVIFTAGEEEIIRRFESFRSNVVFSAESNCSPLQSLASRYPEVQNGYRFLNSGGFIGYAPSVYDMLPPNTVTDDVDDQLYYSLSYLDENFRNSIGITLDTQAVIFQSLHGAQDNVSLVYMNGDAKLKNQYTNTTPLIIHGNGNDGKLLLHTFSSYLAKSWTPLKGCLSCEEGRMNFEKLPIEEYPMVLMGIFIDNPSPFLKKKLKKVSELSYHKKRMYLFVSNKVVEHEELVRRWVNGCQDEYAESRYISSMESNLTIGDVRELAIKMCLNRTCEVFFNVDSEVTIENHNILRILISYRKTALGPVMIEPGTSRSTFWGGITQELNYVESFDYRNIISNRRRGIWNVPQLFHIYVIWRYILENPFYDGGITGLSAHPDIAISHIIKITKNFSMFLYAINLEYYGYLSNMNYNFVDHQHQDLWQVQSNPKDWEERYLHHNFREHLEKNFSSKMICPDVFLLPLFSEDFCKEMTEILESKIKKFNKKAKEINIVESGVNVNVNSRAVSMRDFGYEEEWRHIITKYVRPFVEKAFNGYHCKGEEIKNFIIDRMNNHFQDVISQGGSGTVALIVALGPNYSQVCPDVFLFPLFTSRFCEEMISVVKNNGKWSVGSNVDRRLNSGYEFIPAFDMHLNQIEYNKEWAFITKKYIKSIAEFYYSGYHSKGATQADFVVRQETNSSLLTKPHHDSSTYTVNVALNDNLTDYQGGGTLFLRYNCSVDYMPIGWAMIYPGRLTHSHESRIVTNGTKYTLVSFIDPYSKTI